MIDRGNTALVEGLESRLFLSAAPQVGGTVRGLVFTDGDGNGVRSRGEAGVPGITVFLDADASGTRDANEPAATTGSGGAYVFRGVAPGRYDVRVEVPEAASATGGGGAFVVVATGRRPVKVKPLGIAGTAEIRGTVSEIMGLELPQVVGPAVGVRVFMDANQDGRWQKGERWAKTDAAGHYAFTGLFAGDYPIFVRRKGWATRGGEFGAAVGGEFSNTGSASFQIYWLGPR
jgi:SdrD B-like protein